MREKAAVMKDHGIQETGDAFKSQYTDLLKAQNMVNSKEQLELQKASASASATAELAGGSKKEQAVSLGKDLMYLANRGTAISQVEVTSILKNSSLLTAQNLKGMSATDRGQVAGALKGIAEAVTDGGLSKYSPPTLKMAKAAASVASSLQASLGKDPVAMDSLNEAHAKAFNGLSGGATRDVTVQLREPNQSGNQMDNSIAAGANSNTKASASKASSQRSSDGFDR